MRLLLRNLQSLEELLDWTVLYCIGYDGYEKYADCVDYKMTVCIQQIDISLLGREHHMVYLHSYGKLLDLTVYPLHARPAPNIEPHLPLQ
jgi:hypothetical protein